MLWTVTFLSSCSVHEFRVSFDKNLEQFLGNLGGILVRFWFIIGCLGAVPASFSRRAIRQYKTDAVTFEFTLQTRFFESDSSIHQTIWRLARSILDSRMLFGQFVWKFPFWHFNLALRRSLIKLLILKQTWKFQNFSSWKFHIWSLGNPYENWSFWHGSANLKNLGKLRFWDFPIWPLGNP